MWCRCVTKLGVVGRQKAEARDQGQPRTHEILSENKSWGREKGEEISTHAAGGDALVTVLEGTGKFTIDGKEFLLQQGESIIMPKDIPHAVYGEQRFKMLLNVVF